MCLIIDKNNPEPITAEQDIVCYKVLRKTLEDDIVRAPIYNFEYTFGQIYTIQNEYFKEIGVCVDVDGDSLAEYGFHSFVTLSDAVQFKCRLSKLSQRTIEYIIAKCTIPNAARFYLGKHIFTLHRDNFPDGYCSEAIRIDEIVNENKE